MEVLQRQVTELETRVRNFTQKKEKTGKLKKAAERVGETVSAWWKNRGEDTLQTGANVGFLFVGAALVSMLGVAPEVAAAAAAWVVTRKKPTKALKKMAKSVIGSS